MKKKILALIVSIVLVLTMAIPVFADDAAETETDTDTASSSGISLDSIDLNSILSSDIIQTIMGSDGVADITSIVMDVVMTVMSGELQEDAEVLAEGVIESTVDSVAAMITQVLENQDLIVRYDPEKVISNLFDVDLNGDDDNNNGDDDDNNDSYDPNELVIGPGDVDGDGKVTAADARLILRRAAKLITFTDAQNKLADVDGDGNVTATDARIVLRVSAGLETL
ncbi:MAG: dockerin type I repeat-containing protein [Clostridiales bacterium]|nr:dockerin type I repeat-containing protein [Clostridiales bacterium]